MTKVEVREVLVGDIYRYTGFDKPSWTARCVRVDRDKRKKKTYWFETIDKEVPIRFGQSEGAWLHSIKYKIFTYEGSGS